MQQILKPLPHNIYSPDMDTLILYCMDALGASGVWTADLLCREYGVDFSRSAVISRRRKLRERGFSYIGPIEE